MKQTRVITWTFFSLQLLTRISWRYCARDSWSQSDLILSDFLSVCILFNYSSFLYQLQFLPQVFAKACGSCTQSPTSTHSMSVLPAGSTLEVEWDFAAAHAGDGGLFVSYDHSLSNRQDMKWFKIANFPQQRQDNGRTLTVCLWSFVCLVSGLVPSSVVLKDSYM